MVTMVIFDENRRSFIFAANKMSASNMELKVQNLWESLSSTSSQRYIYAAEVASDLYSLCIEQITEAELGQSY